jgi:hypothetical protein
MPISPLGNPLVNLFRLADQLLPTPGHPTLPTWSNGITLDQISILQLQYLGPVSRTSRPGLTPRSHWALFLAWAGAFARRSCSTALGQKLKRYFLFFYYCICCCAAQDLLVLAIVSKKNSRSSKRNSLPLRRVLLSLLSPRSFPLLKRKAVRFLWWSHGQITVIGGSLVGH